MLPRWRGPMLLAHCGGHRSHPRLHDSEKYVQIPNKRELDLGKPLVLDFAGQFLPDDFDEAAEAPMPDLRICWIEGGALDHWYDFEAKAKERALRTWCDPNSIEVGERIRSGQPAFVRELPPEAKIAQWRNR